MDKHIETILRYADFQKNQRRIIAIDGLSRSGKTTLVHQLSKTLDTMKKPYCMLHIDDYIVEKSKRYLTKHPQWHEYYYLQWDINNLTKRLFKKLTTSELLFLPVYVEETDTHVMQKVTLPNDGLVIIEGVFLQRPEWREYFDTIIYLDCDREERFQRESLDTQANIEKFRERYWKAEAYYVEQVKPEKNADIVLYSSSI